MPATEKRTFSLPAEQAAFIDAKVVSGAFATASEVVRAGLRALQERDDAVERWLREEVVLAYDEMKAHPERGMPLAQVMDDIRAHHAERLKNDSGSRKMTPRSSFSRVREKEARRSRVG